MVDLESVCSACVAELLEEERISAYFGAGLLYAKPSRLEPLI